MTSVSVHLSTNWAQHFSVNPSTGIRVKSNFPRLSDLLDNIFGNSASSARVWVASKKISSWIGFKRTKSKNTPIIVCLNFIQEETRYNFIYKTIPFHCFCCLPVALSRRSTEISRSSRMNDSRPIASKTRLGLYKSCWWFSKKE